MDTTSVEEICSCGLSMKGLSNIAKACHLKAKSHEVHMKYKDITIDDKITCIPCGISMKVMSYTGHLESNLHKSGVSRNETYICECGETIFALSKERHEKSKAHIRRIHSEDEKLEVKLLQYEANKDISNCCKRCLKISIPDMYFIPGINLCICCDEILRGGEKRCIGCKEVKNISTFERPYLIRCKKCACIRSRKYYNVNNKENIPYIHDPSTQESAEWVYKINV